LLPAKPDSGNCPAFYCRLFKIFTPTRTGAVFCLSRRQSPFAPWKHWGDHLAVKKNTPIPQIIANFLCDRRFVFFSDPKGEILR
jgi:hypothetical protein